MQCACNTSHLSHTRVHTHIHMHNLDACTIAHTSEASAGSDRARAFFSPSLIACCRDLICMHVCVCVCVCVDVCVCMDAGTCTCAVQGAVLQYRTRI